MATRIWILLMAMAIGVALTATFLHQSSAQRTRDQALLEQLRRDRVEIELWLRIDARKRLDAISPIAAQPDIRSALRSSFGGQRVADVTVRRKLKRRLSELNADLKEGRGELLMAVDAEGDVIADVRANTDTVYSVRSLPLFQDAIRGFVRDDVWFYNGALYRMAARPVIDGGRYVGAILHGIALNDELAKRLSERIGGAGVGFFVGNELLADYSARGKTGQGVNLVNALAETHERHAPSANEHPKALQLDQQGVIASLVTGAASHAGAGYLIARGIDESAAGLFAGASQEDLSQVPWHFAAGIPLLLGFLGLFLLYRERDKPLYTLVAASKELVDQNTDGLPLGRLKGRYRLLADRINAALRQGVGVSHDHASRSGIALDKILSANGDGASDDFFGYSNGSGATNGSGANRRPRDPETVDRPIAPRIPSPLRGDDPMAEEQTKVSAVPKELLSEFAFGSEEERHFREVFDRFVSVQKQCGGPVDGLTYEKFARKLRATRDDVRKRHQANTVRFTVYVKDGRAALRANPTTK